MTDIADADIIIDAKNSLILTITLNSLISLPPLPHMNTFGNILRLTTFGESHGAAMGGVVDGFPAGISIDIPSLQAEVARRRPGQGALTTARSESDEVEILSGLFEGRTTGTPLAFIVRNEDHRSADYEALRHVLRPSHADFTYLAKYGIRDHRDRGRTQAAHGARGRASARETLCRVVGGALARQALKLRGITVRAYTSQVGTVAVERPYQELDLSRTYESDVRCPDDVAANRMREAIEAARREGDTIGGVATCIVSGCPAGLGEPVAGKLNAALAAAMMSINAAKGFEVGDGFAMAAKKGSEMNDAFVPASDDARGLRTLTNHSGGIQGGISNGEDIVMRVAFKPVPTLLSEQTTTTDAGAPIRYAAHGRHDPCVLPRAVPIVEAMAALTILDYYLLNAASRM